MELKEKPKASALPSGKLVEVYIQLRDRRAQRKAAFENEDADDKGKQEKIEGMLLQRFKLDGVDSVKTPFGTAYTENVASASVADTETFFSFCMENDQRDLMDIRANKTNVKQYQESTDDLPPGVNWTVQTKVKVRRS